MPDSMWLRELFRKYHLCKNINLQPLLYDEMYAQDVDALWLIDQAYIDKDRNEHEIEKSRQRSRVK